MRTCLECGCVYSRALHCPACRVYTPTADEIKAAAALVRMGWSEAIERQRNAYTPKGVELEIWNLVLGRGRRSDD